MLTNSDTVDAHEKFEVFVDYNWVRNNYLGSFDEYNAGGAYNFMCNSQFVEMANNFSELAYKSYVGCKFFQEDYRDTSIYNSAKVATGENIKRTQRAVAGLLYRYLRDTGREW